jgi:hypothetical protein
MKKQHLPLDAQERLACGCLEPHGTHWAIRLRRRLLLPFPCRWNAFVRDWTARLEK